jgi:hypothetical protein
MEKNIETKDKKNKKEMRKQKKKRKEPQAGTSPCFWPSFVSPPPLKAARPIKPHPSAGPWGVRRRQPGPARQPLSARRAPDRLTPTQGAPLSATRAIPVDELIELVLRVSSTGIRGEANTIRIFRESVAISTAYILRRVLSTFSRARSR